MSSRSRMTLLRARLVGAVGAVALVAASAPSAAYALASGGYSCGDQVPGAYWTATDTHELVPDPDTSAGKSWPRFISNRWTVSYEPDQGAPASSQDCQEIADPIASTDSPDATSAGQRTGRDGSNCSFADPPDGQDHGSANCDNGSITVGFAPAVNSVESSASIKCPKFRAPRPPRDTSGQRRFYFAPHVSGTSCTEARRVIPKVWKVPVRRIPSGSLSGGIYSIMVIRTAPSSTHGVKWYCAVDLGADRSRGRTLVTGEDVCVEAAQVPGYGLMQFGPRIEFSI